MYTTKAELSPRDVREPVLTSQLVGEIKVKYEGTGLGLKERINIMNPHYNQMKLLRNRKVRNKFVRRVKLLMEWKKKFFKI